MSINIELSNIICCSKNSSTERILILNPKLINWSYLSQNINDWAVNFLLKKGNINNIDWFYFLTNINENAVSYIITNIELLNNKLKKIIFKRINANESNTLIKFLIYNIKYIDYYTLSRNHNKNLYTIIDELKDVSDKKNILSNLKFYINNKYKKLK